MSLCTWAIAILRTRSGYKVRESSLCFMCTDSYIDSVVGYFPAIHVDGSMFGLPWALAYRNVAKDIALGRALVAPALEDTSTRGMLGYWQSCRPRSATVPAWGYNQLNWGFKHTKQLFKSLSRDSHKTKAPGRSLLRNPHFSGIPGIGFNKNHISLVFVETIVSLETIFCLLSNARPLALASRLLRNQKKPADGAWPVTICSIYPPKNGLIALRSATNGRVSTF